MLAAVVVLSGSVDSVAAAVLVPVVPVLVAPVPVPHEPELPALAPPLLVQVPRELLLHLLSLPLPQVVVESEVPLHLQGRQSFSAAMARSSPPTERPTYERAPSTR
jgi:hypothetical protein